MSIGDFQRERALSQERAQVCNDIMDQRISLVEGVRRVVSLGVRLGVRLGVEEDKLHLKFRDIALRSDHYPIGESREDWDPIALQRVDAEREAFERELRDAVFEYCRLVSERFRSAYRTSV